MQGFQTHTAIQPISIQPLQTQQKPCVTEARHNAEKHSLLTLYLWWHKRREGVRTHSLSLHLCLHNSVLSFDANVDINANVKCEQSLNVNVPVKA